VGWGLNDYWITEGDILFRNHVTFHPDTDVSLLTNRGSEHHQAKPDHLTIMPMNVRTFSRDADPGAMPVCIRVRTEKQRDICPGGQKM
jgi:hypothetical protein